MRSTNELYVGGVNGARIVCEHTQEVNNAQRATIEHLKEWSFKHHQRLRGRRYEPLTGDYWAFHLATQPGDSKELIVARQLTLLGVVEKAIRSGIADSIASGSTDFGGEGDLDCMGAVGVTDMYHRVYATVMPVVREDRAPEYPLSTLRLLGKRANGWLQEAFNDERWALPVPEEERVIVPAHSSDYRTGHMVIS